ncbi:MAG: PDZ domain-containing protein, partial [Chloroflexota bacterium]
MDNDDTDDVGVMVYTPAYWNNTFGDPFLEVRDIGGGGWSTAYAGTDTNSDSEVEGGHFLIYAPEAGQGFPSNFGDDGLLFTEDDPIVTVPQGWTTVDMNTSPFTFDRSAEANIDMLEPPSLRVNDFSEMGYVDAFDASIDLMRRRYSFTEYKNIDWDQIEATYRPLVVEAEENDDALAFKLAMRNLSYELPDGHVSLGGRGSIELNQFFTEAISGGIGMNIMELDDTRVIVSFILEGSPAEAARISEGDEIVAIDGIPIQEVLDSTFIFGAYSTDEFRRIQELRYAVRRPIGTVMDVTYRNAESGELNTTRMVTVDEVETFNRTSTRVGFPEFVGPVEFELLESGYGYVQISSFNQNEVLTVQDWEYFLTTVKNAGIPGIIVDMR